MKKLPLAVFLALAGVGLPTQSAHALSYTEGDLFIGFYDSATTTDYVLDIGQASLYTKNNGSSFTVLPSSNGSNLSTIFTSDGGAGGWYANGNTLWGVVAGPTSTDLGNTLYATTPEEPTGTLATASFSPNSNGNQGGFKTSFIDAMENDFANNGTAFNGTNGTTQSTTDSNSYYKKGFGASIPFGFANGFAGDINNSGGGEDTVLDFFQMIPKSEPGFPNGAVTYEGSFTIDSTGTVTYKTAGAVPEPSTFTALAGGMCLLGLIRRRRRVVAA